MGQSGARETSQGKDERGRPDTQPGTPGMDSGPRSSLGRSAMSPEPTNMWCEGCTPDNCCGCPPLVPGALRVVVCGSRNWPPAASAFITTTMMELIPFGSLIITGGARGVDTYAQAAAENLAGGDYYRSKVIGAEWGRYGKRAGILRNLKMLDEKPHGVVAFIWGGSAGTTHTVLEARKRGVETWCFTDDDFARLHPEWYAEAEANPGRWTGWSLRFACTPTAPESSEASESRTEPAFPSDQSREGSAP